MALLYLLPRGALDTLFLGDTLKIASVGKDCSYLPCRGREAQMAAGRSGQRLAWERWPETVGLPQQSAPPRTRFLHRRGASAQPSPFWPSMWLPQGNSQGHHCGTSEVGTAWPCCFPALPLVSSSVPVCRLCLLEPRALVPTLGVPVRCTRWKL